ncbi:hypothetical protein EXIGLDRAFT_486557 [Exidia glandulosa HHB12029]|uniref:Uncharacterized protein n=1 Tax=Exidia glandulosa HHB12029 TaxID=1314781 RepID=A0A166NEN1_EXIGL|nr:hypothetical protein EXIGLDRAFT_486557 [Exidia glandulosa HHB12029]
MPWTSGRGPEDCGARGAIKFISTVLQDRVAPAKHTAGCLSWTPVSSRRTDRGADPRERFLQAATADAPPLRRRWRQRVSLRGCCAPMNTIKSLVDCAFRGRLFQLARKSGRAGAVRALAQVLLERHSVSCFAPFPPVVPLFFLRCFLRFSYLFFLLTPCSVSRAWMAPPPSCCTSPTAFASL